MGEGEEITCSCTGGRGRMVTVPPAAIVLPALGGLEPGHRACHPWPVARATRPWPLGAAPLTGLGLFHILVRRPCEREAFVCLGSPVKRGIRGPSFPAAVPFLGFLLTLEGRQTLLGKGMRGCHPPWAGAFRLFTAWASAPKRAAGWQELTSLVAARPCPVPEAGAAAVALEGLPWQEQGRKAPRTLLAACLSCSKGN